MLMANRELYRKQLNKAKRPDRIRYVISALTQEIQEERKRENLWVKGLLQP